MPTPVSQQIVRDTFTRANAGTLGANWTSLSDAFDTVVFGITSNAAQVATVGGGHAASFWNANTFTANQYSQAIAGGSAVGTNTHVDGVIVRGSAGGYYGFTWNLSNGASGVEIFKVVAGVFTDLGFITNGPAVLGSLMRLEVVGTTLNAYIDGNLVLTGTANDAALSSGAPGIVGAMNTASPTAFLTNFEGGNLVWTRQGTAIPVGANGGSEEPSVWYLPNPKILSANADGKIWKQWFTNGWNAGTLNIYYAESSDGITWTQYVSNPVLTDGANNVAHGYVLPNPTGGGFVGYFVNDAFTNTAFNRWTSPDGITWTKVNSSVLAVGAGGQWDSGTIFNPLVWVSGGTWFMLYAGRSASIYSIGLATSPDGITWTKYVLNPVISNGSGSANNGKTIVKNGSLYYLWGYTSPTSSLPSDMTIWSSPDLHTWTPCPKGVIYPRVLANEGANLSSGQVADEVLVELNGTTYMFYDAIDTQVAGKIHNNLATAPFSLLQLTGLVFGNNIISGNVGLPGATVNYSGPASGSVFADSAGNYVIPVSANGTYTVTPAPAGIFTPTNRVATVTSADVAGVNFTAALIAWMNRQRKLVNKR